MTSPVNRLIKADQEKALDGVYFDEVLGVAGTDWPIGTPGHPVDNLADALLIMTSRGYQKLYLDGTGVHAITLTNGIDIAIVGNPSYTITIAAGAAVGISSGLLCQAFVNTTGTPQIQGNIIVIGTISTTTGTVTVIGDLICDSMSNTGTGSFVVYGKTITGSIINSGLGDVTFNGGLKCRGGFNNTGGDDFYAIGEVFIGGTLTINGASTVLIYGDVYIAGALAHSSTGSMTIYGNTFISSTTTVSAAAGSLVIHGNAKLVGAVGATNAASVITIDGKAQILGVITATGTITYRGIHPEVAVNTTATNAAETAIFDLSVATHHYNINDFVLKCADPGVNTVTVRLYKLVNAVSTVIDTFAITTVNFASYFLLMDMFGERLLSGDNLKVTVRASAGGPYTVTGSYTYSDE